MAGLRRETAFEGFGGIGGFIEQSIYSSSNLEKKTVGYLMDLYPVPLIHSYNPTPQAVLSRLILKHEGGDLSIKVGAQDYVLKRFLVVQTMDDNFTKDSESTRYTPTIKPHYAVALENADRDVYNASCRILVHDENDTVIFNGRQNVHVHHRRLSPCVKIDRLRNEILEAKKASRSLFLTSYVIDEVGHQVLATTHCLLNEKDVKYCFGLLDKAENPTTDILLNKTPLASALRGFERLTAEACLKKVGLMASRSRVSTSHLLPVSPSCNRGSVVEPAQRNETPPPSPRLPEKKEFNDDWFQLMFDILAMKEVQLAAIALGTVILLSCSGVGMIALGGGLLAAGVIGLTISFFSPHQDEVKTDTGPTFTRG